MSKYATPRFPENTYVRALESYQPAPVHPTAMAFGKGAAFRIIKPSPCGNWFLAKSPRLNGGHKGWVPVVMVEPFKAPMRWARL
jgi:hypothetical protein